MRATLFAVVLLALVGLAAAADTTISRQMYSDDKCATATGTPVVVYNAGQCNGDAGQYSNGQCSNAGAQAYAVAYSNSTCSAASITSMSELYMGCQTTTGGSWKWICTMGTQVAPAFPPASSVVATSYFNMDGSSNSTCSTGAAWTTKSASVTGAASCSLIGGGVYGAAYCANGGSFFAEAYFTDKACTAANLQLVGLSSTGQCVDGTSSSCQSDSVSVPSGMGNQGQVQWPDTTTGDKCSGNFKQAYLVPEATCFQLPGSGSGKFTCTPGVNGTTATFQQWNTDLKCTGTASTTETNKAPDFDPTVAQTVCVAPKAGSNEGGHVFTCHFQGGSASTISVSMIALLAASILAFLSAKL